MSNTTDLPELSPRELLALELEDLEPMTGERLEEFSRLLSTDPLVGSFIRYRQRRLKRVVQN